jgi:hypothetical protein
VFTLYPVVRGRSPNPAACYSAERRTDQRSLVFCHSRTTTQKETQRAER